MKQYVIFNVGDRSFGVDILDVVEIIKPTKIVKLPETPLYVEGIIDVRGSVVPIYNLAKRLGIEQKAENQKIIIVELSLFSIGFLVDDVSEILKIEEEKIEKVSQSIKGVKRQYIDSVAHINDELIIILDLKNVLSMDDQDEIVRYINKQ